MKQCGDNLCNKCGSANCHCNECCGQSSGTGFKSECDMTAHLFDLANQAWEELLKEKIKKVYEKKLGEHLNKTAQVAADGCADYWQSKIQEKTKCKEFQEKVKEAMTS